MIHIDIDDTLVDKYGVFACGHGIAAQGIHMVTVIAFGLVTDMFGIKVFEVQINDAFIN